MKLSHLFLLFIFFISACQSDKKATNGFDSELIGAVSYRDNSKLPGSAEIIVKLLDVSNGASKVVREIKQDAEGRTIPFIFALGYNKKDIKKGNTYALDAEINFAGNNLYYTLEPIEVINSGPKNDVAMILVKGPKQSE